MKQYCRYCCHAILHDIDLIYCSEKKLFLNGNQVTNLNKCPSFDFCPMDVLNPDREYKPRESQPQKDAAPAEDTITENQLSLFNLEE